METTDKKTQLELLIQERGKKRLLADLARERDAIGPLLGNITGEKLTEWIASTGAEKNKFSEIVGFIGYHLLSEYIDRYVHSEAKIILDRMDYLQYEYDDCPVKKGD